MLRTQLISILMAFSANTFAYYYYPTNSTNTEPPKMRMACPNCNNTEKETFYGQSMGLTGFSMNIPESYVTVMKYCYGLSTNVNKMMNRALTLDDHLTKKRLDCYTRGLGQDIESFELNGLTALEVATVNKNQTAITYLNSL